MIAKIDRVRVDSASLASIGYSTDDGVLEVEFRTGDVYRFFLVPSTVWSAVLASDSKGAYFNGHVRDRYPSTKVAPNTADNLSRDLQRSLDAIKPREISGKPPN